MPKGHKRIKGVPELHDELKTRVSISLTPTAVMGLDSLAGRQGLSRSELIELIGREKITINSSLEKPESLLRYLMVAGVEWTPFNGTEQLPMSSGVYLVVDKYFHVFSGSTSNLYQEFKRDSILEMIRNFFINSNQQDLKIEKTFNDIEGTLKIFWIECHHPQKQLDFFQKLLLESFYRVIAEQKIKAVME